MKIEVKNLRVNLAFSEETIMFKADVWINGIKSCYAENQGMGGCTNVSWYNDIGKSLYYQAEKYLNGLPPKVITYFDKTWEQNQTLENFVDDYVDEYVKRKEDERFSKKLQKDMIRGLIFSKDNLKSYRLVSWKNKTLADILELPNSNQILTKEISKAKQEGYIIHNTNLPQYFLN